jgi:hypothetical protein
MGIDPHIIVIGTPLLIIFIMTSQQVLSMSMLIMPLGFIRQLMPWGVISMVISGIMGIPQQLIIGIPQHIIMQGVPLCIMVFIIVQVSFIISIVTPSPLVMAHIMPLSVMVQDMWHGMGSIIGTGMGMDIGADIGMPTGIGAADFIGSAPVLITEHDMMITSSTTRRNSG